ncbi:MAG: thioredoxin family protein, partial [Anaerolineae bacterium]
LVFLTVTSLVYVLFIAGLFTMFTVISFVGWIRIVVALVALFFGAVNIKDYFWYKEGISFTISDEKKPGLYRSMRRVLNAGESMPALIGATVVMSAGASLVEFSCTAGFPVLWTNLLASQGVAVLTFVALLVLYMLIYQIDEIGIFLAAVFSLRASKLEEKHGRILKLIGGTLMLTLAAVMLINPNLMSNIGAALLIFLIAFGVAALILLVHRMILPRFGVHIGTEFAGKRARSRPSWAGRQGGRTGS